MARRILGRSPAIGKRWPYRFFNFLPSKQVWKYLTWQSGGLAPEPAFQLGKAMADCRRLLIILPADLQDLFISVPVLQSLIQELPKTAIHFLVDKGAEAFLGPIFGADRVVTMDPDFFFWGELHFREVLRGIQAFRPDLTLNLRGDTSPLLHYLIRSSYAPLRAQVSRNTLHPFANITLQPGETENRLRHFILAVRLWDAAGQVIPCKWSRLMPTPDNLREAAAFLNSKGLKGDNTRLFLWQDKPFAAQKDVLRTAAADRHKSGMPVELAIVYGSGPLLAVEPPPTDIMAAFPCLQVESTGLLLGLFSKAKATMGMNGPLLHLASLTDTDVQGFFTQEDAPWDTSFLNPRLKIRYLDEVQKSEKKSPNAG